MLEVVDERVLERRVEQRREVAPHITAANSDPGDDREADEAARPASGGPAGSSAAASRARRPAGASVIGAASASSGAATRIEQQVLDHVDREQRRVVALDPRQQRERQGRHAGEEGDGPPARHAVCRVRRVDPADRPRPPHERDQDRQRRQRLERPAEEQIGRRRRLRRHRARGPRAGAAAATNTSAAPRRQRRRAKTRA